MPTIPRAVIDQQNAARTARTKGDALRRNHHREDALAAYQEGVDALEEARNLLGTLEADAAVVNERVEVNGALGGMLQRMGRLDEALDRYRDGAALEEAYALPSTYNRLNAVKYGLLTGRNRLEELEPRLAVLASLIDSKLKARPEPGQPAFADSGWPWADLGDCLALLGRTEEAARAYRQFIARAETSSPKRSLEVLQAIATQMESSADPRAGRLRAAIGWLESELSQ